MYLSVAELKKALRIRTKAASAIQTKIAKLEANIARLKKQLDEILGGTSVKTKVIHRKIKAQRKVKRVKNECGTLKESLIKVLTQAGKPLHINDILKGLKAVGYKSGAKDIKKQVGVRLYTIKQFVKTAPGIFALKAMGAKVKAVTTRPVVASKKTKEKRFPKV